jgi:hypothetical protein
MRRTFQVPRKRDVPDSRQASGSVQPKQRQHTRALAELPTNTDTVAVKTSLPATDSSEIAFQALYTARSNKKRNNKTWTGAVASVHHFRNS